MLLSQRFYHYVNNQWFPKNEAYPPLYWSLLEPVSLAYRGLSCIKHWMQKPKKVDKPVICVGNITLGGNGKTPLVAMIANHMQASGLNPHILTRGYKGSLKASTLVEMDHTYRDVGDEAILLSRCAPTWVGKNRYESAKKALATQADILLMDDGFQNFSLHKDLSIILVDAVAGLGNGRLFPVGPLRETYVSALKRADALFIIDDNENARGSEKISPLLAYVRSLDKPIFFAHRFLRLPEEAREKKCIAFSGLAGPSTRFLSALDQEGIKDNICDVFSFPDHHDFSEKQACELLDVARRKQALLLTTEKDHVRLERAAKGSALHELCQMAHPVPMGLEMDSWDEFEGLMMRFLPSVYS